MADESHDQDETLALPDEELPEQAETAEGDDQATKPKLSMTVDIKAPSACERHVTVTIAREDIDRYFNKDFSELMTSAQVPGFRPGHTPRRLVETRFRKEVAERVKSELLMDSIAQVSKEQDLSPISEPDFDLEAVNIPDEGPMTYEFDLEVRPEFDVPEWRGLTIERPVREFADRDVDEALQRLLANRGQLTPHAGPAEMGDYISTNLTFLHGEQVLSHADEELIRLRPVLSFRDGRIERFGELMKGVRAGETRRLEAQLTEDAPNEALRGQQVTAVFDVQEVKRLELPELTPEFLQTLGDFESVAELRDVIRDTLQRQLGYQQHQRAREQITKALTVAANWDLPPALLRRQSQRELQRAVMELRRSGFSDEQVRAHENEIRQNSLAMTARALKEHFILERIAEDQQIEETPEDYEAEIRLLAAQSHETPRRVRARLEKQGGMDVLRNQIIERKVIEMILAQAQFKDVPYRPESVEAEAIDRAAGGGEPASDIPEVAVEKE